VSVLMQWNSHHFWRVHLLRWSNQVLWERFLQAAAVATTWRISMKAGCRWRVKQSMCHGHVYNSG
jgi:hypothetical protein